jgi:DNA-binding transcriptional LysR family regulator
LWQRSQVPAASVAPNGLLHDQDNLPMSWMIYTLFEEVMDLLGALGALVRVIEAGSFSAVARERHVSQPSVTRQIELLEQHFGVRLLHRTTRRLSLTDDGEMLVGHARTVLDAVEGMEEALGRQRSSPAGLVRVGIPSTGAVFLATRIPLLLERHPELKVELVARDRFGDLVEERLDLAVCLGELEDSSLRMRQMRVSGMEVVAAPSYLERRGIPSVPEDLANHTCLIRDTGRNSFSWHFTRSGKPFSVRVSGGFVADGSGPVRIAAIAGHGIAMLPDLTVFDDVRTGQLIRLLTEYPSPQVPVHLVYSSRRNLALRTRVVMDFLLEQAREISALIGTGSE